jgi:hypothetical protein
MAVTVSGLAAITSNAQMHDVRPIFRQLDSGCDVAGVLGIVGTVIGDRVDNRSGHSGRHRRRRIARDVSEHRRHDVGERHEIGAARDVRADRNRPRLVDAAAARRRRTAGVGDSGGRTTTDQAGAYAFDNLPTGRIFVEFTKSGYQLLEINVTLDGNQQQDVSLDLVRPYAAARRIP